MSDCIIRKCWRLQLECLRNLSVLVVFKQLGINDTVRVTMSLNEVDNLLVNLIHIQSSIKNLTLIDAIYTIHKHFHLLLIEDFKLPQIDWRNDIVYGSHISFAVLFYNTVQNAFMFQHVKLPAKIDPGNTIGFGLMFYNWTLYDIRLITLTSSIV